MDDLRVPLSPETRAYLRAWYHWAINGAPDGAPFDRDQGLCWNALNYQCPSGNPPRNIILELRTAFAGAFPFGAEDFWNRRAERKLHSCPKRRTWALVNGRPD